MNKLLLIVLLSVFFGWSQGPTPTKIKQGKTQQGFPKGKHKKSHYRDTLLVSVIPTAKQDSNTEYAKKSDSEKTAIDSNVAGLTSKLATWSKGLVFVTVALAVATLLLAIATFLLVCISRRQLGILKIHARMFERHAKLFGTIGKTMGTMAGTLEKTVSVSSDTSRAHVFVGDDLNAVFRVAVLTVHDITLVNYGQTPAIIEGVQIRGVVSDGDIPDEPAFSSTEDRPSWQYMVAPEEDCNISPFTPSLNILDFQGITKSDKFFYLFLRYSYIDIYRIVHTRRACFQLLVNDDGTRPFICVGGNDYNYEEEEKISEP